jgi:hypothetical protein
VAGHRAVFSFGRALADGHRVDQLAAALRDALAARKAHRPSAAQRPCQLAVQRTAGLDEQGQVDRFVRHPHRLVVRMIDDEASRALLRRPTPLEARSTSVRSLSF